MKKKVYIPLHSEYRKLRDYTDKELVKLTPVWVYPFFFEDKEKAKQTFRERDIDDGVFYFDNLIDYEIDPDDRSYHGHLHVVTMIDHLYPSVCPQFKVLTGYSNNPSAPVPLYNEDDTVQVVANDMYTAFIKTDFSYYGESQYNPEDGSNRWIVREHGSDRILRIYDYHVVLPMCKKEDVFDMIRL